MTISFSHSPAVRAAFPILVCGVVRVTGRSDGADVSPVASVHLDRARERLMHASEGDFLEVRAWRRTFAPMGLKPTQYRAASEALLRRLRKEGSLPVLHPLADLCNAVSAAFAIPVAVFDANRIEGGLVVRPARGDERYDSFGGAFETPEAGEIIFADDGNRAHSRRWTNRQSAASAIGGPTTQALIVAEALHDGASADIASLMATLRKSIPRIWPDAMMEDRIAS